MVSEAELGTKEAKVAEWRRILGGKSEEELIHEMHSWIESSERHIAAKQLLLSIQEAKARQRHRETITETARSNNLSRIAIGIAAFALIVAVLALTLQWHDSPSSKKTTEEAIRSSQEKQPQPPSSPLLANPARATQQQTPSAPQAPRKP